MFAQEEGMPFGRSAGSEKIHHEDACCGLAMLRKSGEYDGTDSLPGVCRLLASRSAHHWRPDF